MQEVRAGSRELKAHLGRYLAIVRAGGAVTVTDRGRPVARIVPLGKGEASAPERAKLAVEAGLAHWSGRKPQISLPFPRPRDGGTLAALVSEGRD